MKNLFLVLFFSITSSIFSQNILEVSISKIGIFAKYGKDSLHLMIANSECNYYTQTYDPVNLKLVINKSKRKIYRFKDGIQIDVLPIKKILVNDSVFTITVTELCDPRYAEYEGQMIDCYLVLDTRKNPIHPIIPKFSYYWNYKIQLNDEPFDYCTGQVTDHVKIN